MPAFSFWNIFFRFRDIDVFYYANYESDDVIRFATKIVKY